MSSLGNYLSSIDTKLKTSTFLNGNNQVVFYEETDLLREDLVFPRFNVIIDKLKGDGYISQRDMEYSFRVLVCGFMRVGNLAEGSEWRPSLQNVIDLTDFGANTSALLYSMLDDHQGGVNPCPGFQMFSGYPEVFYESELIPNILTFTIALEAKIINHDTEE